MNHKDRRKLKRKRWLQKKKAKAAEERKKDREKRIEERAEQLLKERQKLADNNCEIGEPAAILQGQEEALPEPTCKKPKLSKDDHEVTAVKEINADHIVRTQKHLGSGSYGSCFLAFYRGMTVVVKELKTVNNKRESKEEAQKRKRRELLDEANIINKLGDHPGVPLLYGVCSKNHPFQLVMQFHGEGCVSLTIARALYSKGITKKREWDAIIMKSAEALEHIHSVGFLHNDLKSNNILLDKRGNVHIPVIIDFGKSRLISDPKGPKRLSSEEKEAYKRKFPHVAQEIVEGRSGQSLSSDIFSFGKIIQQIYDKCKFGEVPQLIKRCVSPNPEERPSCSEIIELYE